MIKQILTIVPHGYIMSGQVILNCDEKTGIVDVSESILVGIPIFNSTKGGNQEIKIDPKMLLSANVKKGMKWEVNGVKVSIGDANSADIDYVNGDDHLAGTAVLDLTGHFVEIVSVNLTGSVEGTDVQLELHN